MTAPLLDVRDLVVRHGDRTVVDGVSFTVAAGETVGLTGPSGSGKSSTAQAVLRLRPAAAGRVLFEGRDLRTLPEAELRAVRPRVQPVFQDPYGSLSPRRRIRDQLAEPLKIHGRWTAAEGPDRVAELLAQVGLDPSLGARLPHELSGGQCQRVCIARALACAPKLLILDEPVSALDPSLRAAIANLLLDLQEAHGLGYLLICHDHALVRHLSHRVLTLDAGKLTSA
ncbi:MULTISPECIES: dipeptide/oligopeptide/nickel ABC transporter ATP-binding protein [unclassified Streptomyces]|uniref:ABC transporter ATP-binding protein n=1 Tax=unclassified Streptomyces TaxID=2593676 RepID=UPI0004C2F9FA